jgi:hypothetical protein
MQIATRVLIDLFKLYLKPAEYLQFIHENQVNIFVDYTNINTAANTTFLQRTTNATIPVLDIEAMIKCVTGERFVRSIVVAGSIPAQYYGRSMVGSLHA